MPGMGRLFGTDGIRGIANRELTPDLALAVGRAAGRVLAPEGGEILVGRDTRMSGPMLECALVAGLCSAGVNARIAGVIPTPGVSFLVRDEGAVAGAVISASHNPVADNGIKFFSSDGYKLVSEVEDEIERVMQDPGEAPVGAGVGTASILPSARDRYVARLLSCIDQPLTGLRVVLDCAFGAACVAAPQAFREAGADIIAINAEPDGSRINVDCGSTALAQVAAAVLREGADFGLAFDGDADRVLAVDERGRPVDGDGIIAMSAIYMQERDELKNSVVVTTVMANLGFRRALHERGIEVVTAPVGDKFVAEAMGQHGAMLGGEQSGHVIFGQHAVTGDGILTGLKVAQTVASTGALLSELAHVFEPYPQVLVNVPVRSRDELERSEVVWEEVRRAEARLGDEGRVLLRASGTEPVVRVMVEAADKETAKRTAAELAGFVETHLG
jgi:phosphoglucosamine mutase